MLLKHLWGGQTDVSSVFVQITDLSKEVFRLKEALGALSPPLGISSSSPTHHGNPGQQVALQNRIAILNQQLQVRRTLTPWWFFTILILISVYITISNEKKLQNKLNISVTFLQDWERKHKQVVAIYRSHLLAAVQVSSMCRYTPEHNLRLEPFVIRCKIVILLRISMCVCVHLTTVLASSWVFGGPFLRMEQWNFLCATGSTATYRLHGSDRCIWVCPPLGCRQRVGIHHLCLPDKVVEISEAVQGQGA